MKGKLEEKPQRTKNGARNGNKSQELGETQGRKIGSVQQMKVNGKVEGKQRKYSGTTQVKSTRGKGQEEKKEKFARDMRRRNKAEDRRRTRNKD